MSTDLTTLDLVVFFSTLIGVMVVGLIAGRREESSEDYFLAGRRIPWWGVAGSIFGSNVSADHLVGMMGLGFAVGFAQSHFELGAIAGLMLLCYGFLPVYRKLRVFTLSEYLERRYDQRSRVAYSLILIVMMAFVHMVFGLYIGARSICLFVGGDALVAVRTDAAAPEPGPGEPGGVVAGQPTAESAESADAAAPRVGERKVHVNLAYYTTFVVALAVIAASYTVLGGLKAVIWTDVMQSVLLLAAGILVALLVFAELGGWSAMIATDAATAAPKMKLYLPSDHPDLPWTGVLTGLLAMHFFYWGTNQFIVQRALAARDERHARLGIVAAGFLKLLIPFFAIAGGIAAYYLFQRRMPERSIASDTVFPEAVRLVVPLGYGILGLISAGLIGAILSSIDSMMNSAATLVTHDLYKRYLRPEAADRDLIRVGRVVIVVLVVISACMALALLDPNSEKNFFLQIANYQNYLTPGLLVAFMVGIVWRRATAAGAIVTILAGIVFSAGVEHLYNRYIGTQPEVYSLLRDKAPYEKLAPKLPDELRGDAALRQRRLAELDAELRRPILGGLTREHVLERLGPSLNFFHRVVAVILLCLGVHVAVSLCGRQDAEKSRLVWSELGGHDAATVRWLGSAMAASLGLYLLLGWGVYRQAVAPPHAAWIAALWTLAMFAGATLYRPRLAADRSVPVTARLLAMPVDDRFWAGVLSATAMFMMYYFA